MTLQQSKIIVYILLWVIMHKLLAYNASIRFYLNLYVWEKQEVLMAQLTSKIAATDVLEEAHHDRTGAKNEVSSV